jgi:hypothetical protein
MTIRFRALAPSEQAIIRRSAAQGRCKGESIGEALRRFAKDDFSTVLCYKGAVVGISLYAIECGTHEITPIGIGRFNNYYDVQRKEFLDRVFASLS